MYESPIRKKIIGNPKNFSYRINYSHEKESNEHIKKIVMKKIPELNINP